jgi:cohesin complex subunit SA-1/2
MLQLKKITRSLRDRLLGLLKDKRENGGVMNADNIDDQIPPEDTEHAICLCLTRLVVLSKRCDLSTLLGKEGQEGDGDQEVERLCAAAAQVVANDLQARKVVIPEEEDETSGSPDIPKIWAARSARLHALVAEIVSQSLSFLLITTAWRLKREIVLVEDSDEAPEDRTEPEENVVVRMRDRLVKLIALCFDQYIEFDEGLDSYTAEHIQFATDVQVHAGRCAGDVRSLFPKAWIDAEYPLLRALALTEEGHLIGGFVRFLRSQEGKVRR